MRRRAISELMPTIPALLAFMSALSACNDSFAGVCTENLIRVDDAMESPKLAE
jgi:hypothetical protein